MTWLSTSSNAGCWSQTPHLGQAGRSINGRNPHLLLSQLQLQLLLTLLLHQLSLLRKPSVQLSLHGMLFLLPLQRLLDIQLRWLQLSLPQPLLLLLLQLPLIIPPLRVPQPPHLQLMLMLLLLSKQQLLLLLRKRLLLPVQLLLMLPVQLQNLPVHVPLLLQLQLLRVHSPVRIVLPLPFAHLLYVLLL